MGNTKISIINKENILILLFGIIGIIFGTIIFTSKIINWTSIGFMLTGGFTGILIAEMIIKYTRDKENGRKRIKRKTTRQSKSTENSIERDVNNEHNNNTTDNILDNNTSNSMDKHVGNRSSNNTKHIIHKPITKRRNKKD